MGLSTAAAFAIIGVSILIVAEVILGDVFPLVADIQESYEEMRDRSIDKLQSDIDIINTTTTTNGTGYDLNITIKNIGSTVIDLRYMDILVEGKKKSFNYNSRYLYPEDETTLKIYNLTGSGNKRLKIITNLGISKYTTYTV